MSWLTSDSMSGNTKTETTVTDQLSLIDMSNGLSKLYYNQHVHKERNVGQEFEQHMYSKIYHTEQRNGRKWKLSGHDTWGGGWCTHTCGYSVLYLYLEVHLPTLATEPVSTTDATQRVSQTRLHAHRADEVPTQNSFLSNTERSGHHAAEHS